MLRSALSSFLCCSDSEVHALHAGILRIAMAARSGQESDASAAVEMAFDLLASLLQHPVAGITVLCAAAAKLKSVIRQHAQCNR